MMYELLEILTAVFGSIFDGINLIFQWAVAITAFNYHMITAFIKGVSTFSTFLGRITSIFINAFVNISVTVIEFTRELLQFFQLAGILARYCYRGLCFVLAASEHILTCFGEWSKKIAFILFEFAGWLWKHWEVLFSHISRSILLNLENFSKIVDDGIRHIPSLLYKLFTHITEFLYQTYDRVHSYIFIGEPFELAILPQSCQPFVVFLRNVVVVGFLVSFFVTLIRYLHKHNCTFPLFSSFFSARQTELEDLHNNQAWLGRDDLDSEDGFSDPDTPSSSLSSLSSSSSSNEDSSDEDDDEDDNQVDEFELGESSSSDEENNTEININIRRRNQPAFRRHFSESNDDDASDLRRRLEEEEEARLCVVCTDAVKSVLVMPCKHVCLCTECALTIAGLPNVRRLCPLCRTPITEVIDVFI